MVVCVECAAVVPSVYRRFSAAPSSPAALSLARDAADACIRLQRCPACGEIVDKYVEYEILLIFVELLLIKRQAYRHVLFNRLEYADFGFPAPIGRLAVACIIFDAYTHWFLIYTSQLCFRFPHATTAAASAAALHSPIGTRGCEVNITINNTSNSIYYTGNNASGGSSSCYLHHSTESSSCCSHRRRLSLDSSRKRTQSFLSQHRSVGDNSGSRLFPETSLAAEAAPREERDFKATGEVTCSISDNVMMESAAAEQQHLSSSQEGKVSPQAHSEELPFREVHSAETYNCTSKIGHSGVYWLKEQPERQGTNFSFQGDSPSSAFNNVSFEAAVPPNGSLSVLSSEAVTAPAASQLANVAAPAVDSAAPAEASGFVDACMSEHSYLQERLLSGANETGSSIAALVSSCSTGAAAMAEASAGLSVAERHAQMLRWLMSSPAAAWDQQLLIFSAAAVDYVIYIVAVICFTKIFLHLLWRRQRRQMKSFHKAAGAQPYQVKKDLHAGAATTPKLAAARTAIPAAATAAGVPTRRALLPAKTAIRHCAVVTAPATAIATENAGGTAAVYARALCTSAVAEAAQDESVAARGSIWSSAAAGNDSRNSSHHVVLGREDCYKCCCTNFGSTKVARCHQGNRRQVSSRCCQRDKYHTDGELQLSSSNRAACCGRRDKNDTCSSTRNTYVTVQTIGSSVTCRRVPKEKSRGLVRSSSYSEKGSRVDDSTRTSMIRNIVRHGVNLANVNKHEREPFFISFFRRAEEWFRDDEIEGECVVTLVKYNYLAAAVTLSMFGKLGTLILMAWDGSISPRAFISLLTLSSNIIAVDVFLNSQYPRAAAAIVLAAALTRAVLRLVGRLAFPAIVPSSFAGSSSFSFWLETGFLELVALLA